MSNIVPFEQQQTLARAFAQSGLFGVKTAEQALALMALCEAEGLHPARAVQRYHIVNGKASMKADTMLAEFQKAGGRVEWTDYTDAKVTGVFSHPAGGSVAVSWDMIQAAKAGLSSKDTWKFYPRSMMRSRCISEGVRAVFPGVVEGIYTPEETESFPSDGQPVIEGHARRVDTPPTKPTDSTTLPTMPSDRFYNKLAGWEQLIIERTNTATEIINFLNTKCTLSDEQETTIKKLETASLSNEEVAA